MLLQSKAIAISPLVHPRTFKRPVTTASTLWCSGVFPSWPLLRMMLLPSIAALWLRHWESPSTCCPSYGACSIHMCRSRCRSLSLHPRMLFLFGYEQKGQWGLNKCSCFEHLTFPKPYCKIHEQRKLRTTRTFDSMNTSGITRVHGCIAQS